MKTHSISPSYSFWKEFRSLPEHETLGISQGAPPTSPTQPLKRLHGRLRTCHAVRRPAVVKRSTSCRCDAGRVEDLLCRPTACFPEVGASM